MQLVFSKNEKERESAERDTGVKKLSVNDPNQFSTRVITHWTWDWHQIHVLQITVKHNKASKSFGHRDMIEIPTQMTYFETF